MRQKLAVALLCAIFGACSCAHPNRYPERPLMPREFAPPSNYRGWYEKAEQCSGMKGNFDEVHWYITPMPWGDTTYAQFYVYRDSLGFPRQAEITISAALWLDSTTVIHESLHDILWRNGWAAPSVPKGMSESGRRYHPSPPFTKCAPVFYPWPK